MISDPFCLLQGLMLILEGIVSQSAVIGSGCQRRGAVVGWLGKRKADLHKGLAQIWSHSARSEEKGPRATR